ncbi:MerR family transcriptional regulator [Biformimicrobium ophioploci]|uniref:HTH-type transcriptional repressor CarH n=1 Tax=Biformimicrobium ophioploci TaxID=3036711 RepID=A0ABQ6LYS3_9GAMM|nr:MerR family transcriptional regulator [Microbulbifer sp. NKW57]GMG87243.1 HTH-type transcriptional repressor CarH [Microbulbifer sp. NKW57]
MNDQSKPRRERFYSIGAVTEMTGVTAATLRSWERRYGYIRPERRESGHRLYSRDQVERIQHIVQLLGQGIRIGQVQSHLDFLQEEADANRTAAQEPVADIWDGRRQAMVFAVQAFNEGMLDAIYEEVLSVHSLNSVTQKLLIPVLLTLGNRWESGDGSVAEEHFFSCYLRNKLGARLHHKGAAPARFTILAACLPGELHELGLLMFASQAHESGIRVVMLGANTPLGNLNNVATKAGADAVVLSSSQSRVDCGLYKELKELAGRVQVPCFVGGVGAVEDGRIIKEIGCYPVGQDIDNGLAEILRTLEQHGVANGRSE